MAGLWMNSEILSNSSLKDGEKIVLAYIASFNGGCFAKNETIAAGVGKDAKAVSYIISNLVKKNCLTIAGYGAGRIISISENLGKTSENLGDFNTLSPKNSDIISEKLGGISENLGGTSEKLGDNLLKFRMLIKHITNNNKQLTNNITNSAEIEKIESLLFEFFETTKNKNEKVIFNLCNKLFSLSGNDPTKTILIIRQSIQNGWRSFYPLRDNQNHGNGFLNIIEDSEVNNYDKIGNDKSTGNYTCSIPAQYWR